MEAKIIKPEDSDEFDTRERCSILELSNDADDPEVSIARARVLPGVTTEWHKLVNSAERYVITQGEGLMEVGELAPIEVAVGDVVRIPIGVRQRITNTGQDDLLFLAICTPRHLPESYQELE